MQKNGHVEAVDDALHQLGGVGRRDRPNRVEAGQRGDGAIDHPPHVGFVELHQHLRAEPSRHLGDVPAQSLGQRRRDVTNRTAVLDDLVASAQLGVRGEGQRPARLHLHGSSGADEPGGFPMLLESIEVPAQPIPRAPRGGVGVIGEPVGVMHHVERQVDEQRAGPADHVGSHSSRGEFGKERQIEFAARDAHRLGRIGAGHGADAGADSGRQPRPGRLSCHSEPVIRPQPITRSPSTSSGA